MEIPYFYTQHYDSAVDVWTETPTKTGVFVYSVLTPSISLCGIAGNFICLLVLRTNDFQCSFYVYLTVIATVDFLSCVLIFMSGLARGVFWGLGSWVAYDALIYIPLAGFLSCVSSIATVFVTIDRLIYLRKPGRLSQPKFCKRKVAAKITFAGILFAALCTIPYCFIYEVTEKRINTTSFYHSEFYAAYNWFDLFVFAVLPLAFLSVGNIMLLQSIKNARRMLKHCDLIKGKTRKMKDQTKVTATLIAIIFFYLIGEVPTHFTSRKTAANILFGGDDEKADASVPLEIARQVTTVLNAFHLAIKFVLYSLFCPPFHRALKSRVLPKSARKRRIEAQNEPLQLFFIDGDTTSNKRIRMDWNQLGFMNLFVNTKAAQELPRLM